MQFLLNIHNLEIGKRLYINVHNFVSTIYCFLLPHIYRFKTELNPSGSLTVHLEFISNEFNLRYDSSSVCNVNKMNFIFRAQF